MTYQTFLDQTIRAMAPGFPKETEFTSEKIKKNNGITLRALIIKTPDTNIFPTLYMDGFFDRAKIGEPIDDLTEEILEIYENCKISEPVDVSCLMDFESVKNRLSIRLVNREKNEEFLKKVPWEPFLDLALVPCIHYDTPEDVNAESIVTNNNLKSWKISPEKVLEFAKENAPKILPSETEHIGKYLNDIAGEVILPENDDNNALYVLTNTKRTHGAACLTYPRIIEDFAERFGSDVFILPSSIHEVMLMAKSEDSSMKELSALVHEVNETQVSRGEFLSDHAYLYHRDTGEFEY